MSCVCRCCLLHSHLASFRQPFIHCRLHLESKHKLDFGFDFHLEREKKKTSKKKNYICEMDCVNAAADIPLEVDSNESAVIQLIEVSLLCKSNYDTKKNSFQIIICIFVA